GARPSNCTPKTTRSPTVRRPAGRPGKSYDLRCTRGFEERHVEVKHQAQTAHELRRRLSGSVVCDAEPVGLGLHRMMPGDLDFAA
ncbi:hypothetical protein ACFCWG_49185, partial [Streptomyces sp. NPDC056390]